jgi:CobQ-like glutamine amidotransferase family enzyme
VPGLVHGSGSGESAAAAGLPPTWRISVDVLNGSGDMNYTRHIASRIGAKAYRIERVTRADRFDYPETAVYFHRGGEQVAQRLADDLGVSAKPLPGGSNQI